MTNTKGTNAEVEERIQYAIELLSQDVPNSVVVEKLHEKYKKSYQTHRKLSLIHISEPTRPY